MYYLIMSDLVDRTRFIDSLKLEGVNCVFHYVPLHSAPQGKVSGKLHTSLPVTDDFSQRLVRLPMWVGLMPEMKSLLSKILNQLRSVTS